jgi:hypothetical protein
VRAYRHSGFVFAAVLVAALVAFWPSYVATDQPIDAYTHVHAALMTAWFALAIAQAFLVRAGRRALHRRLGLVSYALVPAIVVVTILLVQARAASAGAIGPDVGFGLYLPLAMVAVFAIAFALAMVYRRDPAVHARYMTCTCLAVVDPIAGRIVGRYLPPLPMDAYPLVTLAILTLATGIAMFRERAELTARRMPLPIMLAIAAAALLGATTVAKTEPWLSLMTRFAAA